MHRTLTAALVLAAFAAPTAFAADDEHIIVLDHRSLAAGDSQGDVWKRWAEDYSREMRISMGTLFAGRVGSAKLVKGVPYSAEVVTENNQPLADGNVITRRTSGLVYRDGAGRTRQESGGDGRERTIYITDPVDAKSYVLTPGAKRAVATAYVAHPVKSGKEVRVEGGKVFVDGKELAKVDGGAHVTRSSTSVSSDGTRREEVRVRVVRSGDDESPPLPPLPPGTVMPLPALPPMPGIQTMRFESTARLGKGVTTSLGTRDFDGVKAEGRSTTWTIPAGEIGNRAPINIVSESWYSPELQITVYSRNADPRTGETLYRLAGIKRGEPGAELFKVPEEYKLRDRTAK